MFKEGVGEEVKGGEILLQVFPCSRQRTQSIVDVNAILISAPALIGRRADEVRSDLADVCLCVSCIQVYILFDCRVRMSKPRHDMIIAAVNIACMFACFVVVIV